jgi:hypothetical protein
MKVKSSPHKGFASPGPRKGFARTSPHFLEAGNPSPQKQRSTTPQKQRRHKKTISHGKFTVRHSSASSTASSSASSKTSSNLENRRPPNGERCVVCVFCVRTRGGEEEGVN